jgi:hypothetical protein
MCIHDASATSRSMEIEFSYPTVRLCGDSTLQSSPQLGWWGRTLTRSWSCKVQTQRMHTQCIQDVIPLIQHGTNKWPAHAGYRFL